MRDQLEKCYFVSDVHLGSREEPKYFRFLKFLQSIQSSNQITHLFLLGDIFDLWVANHQYFKNKFSDVIAELIRLKSVGVEIHYFEGNHDLYLEHYFSRELGFTIHKGPAYFNLSGRKVRVEHGDEMDPTDRGYRFLRWFLRTPLMQWLAPRLPGWFVVWIGQRASHASREYTSQVKSISNAAALAVIRGHAEKVFRDGAFDIVISGHVHVLEDYHFSLGGKTGRAVNLGSWFGDTPRVFFLAPDAAELRGV